METRLSLEIFFQVTEDEVDGCFVAHAVGHDIVVQGETEVKLRENVRDAVHGHFGDSPTVRASPASTLCEMRSSRLNRRRNREFCLIEEAPDDGHRHGIPTKLRDCL